MVSMDKIEELKTGLASIGIGWVEPTDLRNKAGAFMLKRGVKMGVAVDPADVQTMLVDFTRQALEHVQAQSKVVEWLQERHYNCLRHAEQKTGDDRDGWLEDAYFFELALTTLAMRNPDVR
jgi:hypothetical protein